MKGTGNPSHRDREAIAGRAGALVQGLWSQAGLGKGDELLPRILDSLPVSLAILDLDGTYVLVNRAYVAGRGLEPSSLVGKNIGDVFPQPGLAETLRSVVRTAQPHFAYSMPFEYPGHPELGVSYWDWGIVPLLGSAGTVEKLLVSSIDVATAGGATAEARRRESMFRQVAENLGDGLWVGALQPGQPTRTVYANAAFGRTFDLADAELAASGTAWFQRVHPSDQAQVRKAMQRFRERPEVGYDLEYRVVHHDGTVRWISARAFAICDARGEFAQVAVLVRDITARQKRDQYYRSMVEESLQALMLLEGPPPRVVLANPRAEEMTGYSSEELLSMTAEDFVALIHPGDREQLFARLAGQFTGQDVPQVGEYRGVRKDGEIRWYRYFASLLPRCEVLSLQVAFLDVTAEKQAEEALWRARDDLERQVAERTAELSSTIERLRSEVTEREHAEELLARSNHLVLALNRVGTRLRADLDLRAVLDELGSALGAEGLTCATLLLDEAGRSLTVQPLSVSGGAVQQFERLAGFPLVGQRFPASLQPFATLMEQEKALYVPDQNVTFGEMLGRVKQRTAESVRDAFGKFVAQPAVYVPLVIGERALGILMVMGNDLRESDVPAFVILAGQVASSLERLRLSREAAELEVLRQVDRLQSELIANVSHEIRTPLGLIDILSSSLLMEDVSLDSGVQREFLQGIREATGSLTELVNNLLDQGRLESGRMRLNRRRVDLAELVRAVVPPLVARSAIHALVLELEPGLWVEGDAARLERVLANLTGNAIKYSPDGGIIRVLGCAEKGQVLLSVSDQGIGIPEAEHERIFERFYRVDNEWTRKIPGIGIGLPLCRGIVDAHGGRIGVDSKPGAGSTFYVLLPGWVERPEAAGRGEENAGDEKADPGR